MDAVQAVEPFWGPPTSKANFCESDYAISRYVAEFMNSLTNIIYVIYGIYGLRQLHRRTARQGTSSSLRALPYYGLMAVGLCSFAFHVSLKYNTQMMDDLSMHFATTPVLHRVLTANSSRRNSIVIAILLASTLTALIAYHIKTDELLLHSASFVGTVTLIGIYTIRLVKARTVPRSASRKQIWGIVRFGAAIFNLGYWLWLVDQWFCGFLTDAREKIGLPWAFLLELHGWWHICTGIGAYVFIALVDHLVSGEEHAVIDQSLAWPAPWASRSIFAGWARTVHVAEKEK